jgi:hypothetical protein
MAIILKLNWNMMIKKKEVTNNFKQYPLKDVSNCLAKTNYALKDKELTNNFKKKINVYAIYIYLVC